MALGLQAGQLYVPITLDQSKFNTALQGVETKLKQTESSLKGFADIGKRLEGVGKSMSLYVTAPIAALGGIAAKASIDLESSFAGVRKTVSGTETELAELRSEFIELGKTIPITTTELMGVGEAAGQLGIDRQHIIGFTEVMAKLGATTDLSSDQAAMALARLANITQMPKNEFDRLGSTVAALDVNLATTASQIVEMGTRIAGAGAQAGLSEAEILGLAGAFSSVGMQAEAGGSAVSRILLKINKEVATSGDNLALFAEVAGMSAEEFARAWKEDAAGAIVAFVEGLARMQDEGQNTTVVLEALEMADLRVADALGRAAGAGDMMRNSLQTARVAWEDNVALTKMAEERFQTTAAQLVILKNNLQFVASTFGDILLPIINKAIDQYIIPLVNWVAEWDEGTKKVVLAVMGLTAVIGPALLLIGKLSQAIVMVNAAAAITGPVMTAISASLTGTAAAATGASVAIGAAGGAMLTTTGATTALGGALAFLTANPIVAAVSAIGLLAATLGTLILRKRQATQATYDLAEAERRAADKAGMSAHDRAVAEQEMYEATKRNEMKIRQELANTGGSYNSLTGDVGAASGSIAKASEAMSDRVRAALDKIGLQERTLRAEYNLSIAKMGDVGTESEKLRLELELQEKELEFAKEKVNILTAAYEEARIKKGETAEATQELRLQLLEAQKAQVELENAVAQTTNTLQGQLTVTDELTGITKKLIAVTRDYIDIQYPSGAIVRTSTGGSSPMTDLQKEAWADIARRQKAGTYVPGRAFAAGGVIQRPVVMFDSVTGKRAGIAGEAGPEAIVPLTGKGGQARAAGTDIDYDRLASAMARHAKPSITQHNKIIAQQPLSPAAVVREENKLLQRLGMAMG